MSAEIIDRMILILRKENNELRKEVAELKATLQEMYFHGADLVERVRMEPVEATVLRVESQTSDKSHAKGLKLMKKGKTDGK